VRVFCHYRFCPELNADQDVPPSVVKNENTSLRPAVLVRFGVTPVGNNALLSANAGHLKEVGHTTVLALPSLVSTNTNELASPLAWILVMLKVVMFEFSVTLNTEPAFKFTVSVLKEMLRLVETSAELTGKNTLLLSTTTLPAILIAIVAPLNSANSIYLFFKTSMSSC
jgi:hypothetical protein